MKSFPRPALVLCLSAITVAQVTSPQARAQQRRTENVVLIVSDGLRWQELFRGADSSLINARWGGVEDTARLRRDFVRESAASSRAALFPFLWTEVARRGRIFGDSGISPVTVTNGLNFSYPGYNEMLIGHADPRIDRNDAGPNPNVTVFEWLDRMPAFHGRVAAFGTWDVFPAIFNRERSGIRVHAGWEAPFDDTITGAHAPGRAMLSRLYATTTRLWADVAPDAFMQATVLDYLRTAGPRVLFVGYGETDEWAHSRRYDQTLRSAHSVDGFIAELWRTMQSMPQYRDRTTFIITTDHGRGGTPADWTDHGRDVGGAGNVWVAMLGPDTPPRSPREAGSHPITQSQIAATVAALLGLDYPAAAPQAARAIGGPPQGLRRR